MTNRTENAAGAGPHAGARRRGFELDARSLGLFRILVALWVGASCIAPPGIVSELAYRSDHSGLNHPSLSLAARVLGGLAALGLLKGFRCRASLALVLAALLAWEAFSRQFDALNGGVLITMLAAMFLVPIGARFSFDSVATAMRRGVRLDRRPADGAPAATALEPSPRTVAFGVITGAGGLWTAVLLATSHSAVPRGAGDELLWLVPLATLVLLLSARQWSAAAHAALRPSRPAYVYYDDSCGFCFRCCQWVALADGAARLTFIGASDRAAHQHAIPAVDLETSVVVVDTVSGAVVRQARAAAAIVRALPVPYQPLRIIAWPGIVWFADRAYDIVARNRHRISLWMGAPACGVDGRRTRTASSPLDPSRTRS